MIVFKIYYKVYIFAELFLFLMCVRCVTFFHLEYNRYFYHFLSRAILRRFLSLSAIHLECMIAMTHRGDIKLYWKCT